MQNHINYWVTNKCNLLCKHCLRGKQTVGKDLPLSIFSNTVNELKNNHGLLSVGFTGGEPCLTNEFTEMINILSENNLSYSVATNGTLLDRYAKLYESYGNLQVLKIGLDGFKQEHNSIRNKEVYNDVINFIKYFRDKVCVVVAYCINKLNYDQTYSFAKFCSEFLKINSLEMFRIIPCDYNESLLMNDEERKIANKQVTQAVHDFRNIKFLYSMPSSLKIDDAIICPSLSTNSYIINQDGYLMLCCNCPGEGLNISNVCENGWNKSINKMLSIRKNIIKHIQSNKLIAKYKCDHCINYFKEKGINE